MSEIINIRKARKERNRREKEEVAAVNRRKFGRTKAEKSKAKGEVELAHREHDGKRLED